MAVRSLSGEAEELAERGRGRRVGGSMVPFMMADFEFETSAGTLHAHSHPEKLKQPELVVSLFRASTFTTRLSWFERLYLIPCVLDKHSLGFTTGTWLSSHFLSGTALRSTLQTTCGHPLCQANISTCASRRPPLYTANAYDVQHETHTC